MSPKAATSALAIRVEGEKPCDGHLMVLYREVIDNADCRHTTKLYVPSDIHIERLSPHTPELKPAERLGPLTNVAVANRSFQSLEELDSAVKIRCRQFSHQRRTIHD